MGLLCIALRLGLTYAEYENHVSALLSWVMRLSTLPENMPHWVGRTLRGAVCENRVNILWVICPRVASDGGPVSWRDATIVASFREEFSVSVTGNSGRGTAIYRDQPV